MYLCTVCISTTFQLERTSMPPDGPTLPELITINLSIMTFSLSRTTVKVSHVAPGEHIVPGPFIFVFPNIVTLSILLSIQNISTKG
jgi:hypothetical protein